MEGSILIKTWVISEGFIFSFVHGLKSGNIGLREYTDIFMPSAKLHFAIAFL